MHFKHCLQETWWYPVTYANKRLMCHLHWVYRISSKYLDMTYHYYNGVSMHNTVTIKENKIKIIFHRFPYLRNLNCLEISQGRMWRKIWIYTFTKQWPAIVQNLTKTGHYDFTSLCLFIISYFTNYPLSYNGVS